MASFTPVSAAIGGVLIGGSAVLLMLLTGRIAGVSGILAGAIRPGGGAGAWRLAFVVGLILAWPLVALTGREVAVPQLPGSWIVIVVGGLLVGFGARLAGGCTSGHAVCGIARVSARSLAATAVFMTVAIAVVAVTHHLLGA